MFGLSVSLCFVLFCLCVGRGKEGGGDKYLGYGYC